MSNSTNWLIMKRGFVVFCLICITTLSFAQFNAPKNVTYKKENDFMLNVLYNPKFCLYDFLLVGLHERNTAFLDKNTYKSSSKVINKCKEIYGNNYNNNTFDIIYSKVKAAWKVFLEVQDCDIDEMAKYFTNYSKDNIFRPRNCPNPELKHKLSIVPLSLEDY